MRLSVPGRRLQWQTNKLSLSCTQAGTAEEVGEVMAGTWPDVMYRPKVPATPLPAGNWMGSRLQQPSTWMPNECS